MKKPKTFSKCPRCGFPSEKDSRFEASGRRGGMAGKGKSKARTSAQARKAAKAKWAKWKHRRIND